MWTVPTDCRKKCRNCATLTLAGRATGRYKPGLLVTECSAAW